MILLINCSRVRNAWRPRYVSMSACLSVIISNTMPFEDLDLQDLDVNNLMSNTMPFKVMSLSLDVNNLLAVNNLVVHRLLRVYTIQIERERPVQE